MNASTNFVARFMIAHAFSASVYAATITTVPIGNPANPADARYPNGAGSVARSFNMGKTEVTNAQYVEFLNAVAAADPYGLYNMSMASDTWGGIVRSGVAGSYTYAVKSPALSGAYPYGDKPVVYVSSGDAMRFANWLHNGQPAGPEDSSTTENGAYTISGATTNAGLSAVTRNIVARWWLPTNDEWYKAAYHKNDGITGNYWEYPTHTSNVPDNNAPFTDTGNSANFYNNGYTTTNSSYPMTDAGAYTLSGSSYGTFDQGGNVREWTETVVPGNVRIIRGGSWISDSVFLRAQNILSEDPTYESIGVGFRVAGIPEPSTTCLGTFAAVAVWCGRRHRS